MLTGAESVRWARRQASLTRAQSSNDDPAPVSSARSRRRPRRSIASSGTCLAKDPDDRWQSAADLASEIDWIAQGGAGAQVPHAGHRSARLVWAMAMATLAAIAAVAAAVVVGGRSVTPVSPTPKRFIAELPLSTNGNAPYPVLAPDGSAMVYASGGGGRSDWQLVLFTFSDGQSRVLPKTDGATGVFYSPDGKRVGFVQRSRDSDPGGRGWPAGGLL